MVSAWSPVNLFSNSIRKEFLSRANKHTDIYELVSAFNQAGKDGTTLATFQDIHMNLKNRFK